MNKQQIEEKLTENHQKFTGFIESLNEADFMLSSAGKWTAGQQLDHIIRGVSPVRTAFSLPKLVTQLIFGTANRESRDYETLVKKYQSKLAAGGKASARFLPSKNSFERRGNLIDKLMRNVNGLIQKTAKFSEQDLDKYILPHPILGKLTFREMLCFTIYHVEHHHKNAIKNLDSNPESAKI